MKEHEITKKKDQKISEGLKFDTRLVVKNYYSDIVQKTDIEKHLKGLKDESDNIKLIEVYEEEKPVDEGLTFISG